MDALWHSLQGKIPSVRGGGGTWKSPAWEAEGGGAGAEFGLYDGDAAPRTAAIPGVMSPIQNIRLIFPDDCNTVRHFLMRGGAPFRRVLMRPP
jgi:hypothetical protein